MTSGRSKSLSIIFWWGSLPALLAASFIYYPFVFDGPVFCPMRLMLGIPCPGCGLTRAFCLMTHGRFLDALEYHALAPAVLGYMTFLWIFKIVEVTRGRAPQLPVYKIGGTACLTLIGFWVIRLIYFFGFDHGVTVVLHDNAIARLSRLF